MTTIALLLFPDLTQLDLTGPYEVFSRCPGARVRRVWKNLDPVVTEHGLRLEPDATFDDLTSADVLCVPGGFGVTPLLGDAQTIGWIRRVGASARYVTSVCTGALLLGAAGLLRGRRATTHWTSFEMLSEFGALPTPGRVVRDGNVFTGGGVTAGIDFALELVAELRDRRTAEAIQLAIEYRPQPPFDAGHPDVAPPDLVRTLRERVAPRQAERLERVRQAARALRDDQAA